MGLKEALYEECDLDLYGSGCGLQTGFSALKQEAVCCTETLVSTYKFTRRNNLEDQHQHFRRRENLRARQDLYCLYPPYTATYSIKCGNVIGSGDLKTGL